MNHSTESYDYVVKQSLSVLPHALHGDGSELTDRLDAVGEMVRNCSFIAGLHPDQATDAILDMALRLGIHFAVVPCCVMPSLFPHRRQRKGSGDPVRSYKSFCQYLLDKASEPNVSCDKACGGGSGSGRIENRRFEIEWKNCDYS